MSTNAYEDMLDGNAYTVVVVVHFSPLLSLSLSFHLVYFSLLSPSKFFFISLSCYLLISFYHTCVRNIASWGGCTCSISTSPVFLSLPLLSLANFCSLSLSFLSIPILHLFITFSLFTLDFFRLYQTPSSHTF